MGQIQIVSSPKLLTRIGLPARLVGYGARSNQESFRVLVRYLYTPSNVTENHAIIMLPG